MERASTQVCTDTTQYDQCSSNNRCACLHIAGAINIGICAEQSLANCSELIPCEPTTNLCHQPYHKCVHHPRCHDHPVCYPIPSYNRQICPPVSGKIMRLRSYRNTMRYLQSPFTC